MLSTLSTETFSLFTHDLVIFLYGTPLTIQITLVAKTAHPSSERNFRKTNKTDLKSYRCVETP